MVHDLSAESNVAAIIAAEGARDMLIIRSRISLCFWGQNAGCAGSESLVAAVEERCLRTPLFRIRPPQKKESPFWSENPRWEGVFDAYLPVWILFFESLKEITWFGGRSWLCRGNWPGEYIVSGESAGIGRALTVEWFYAME